jgi:hypothetical protein
MNIVDVKKVFMINNISQLLTGLFTVSVIVNDSNHIAVPLYIFLMFIVYLSTQIDKLKNKHYNNVVDRYKAKEKLDDISKRILRHDVNNTLMENIKYVRRDKISEADLNRIEILRLLDSTDFSYKHKITFDEILGSTLSTYDYNLFDVTRTNKNIKYKLNKYVMISILRNLYNNAIEAYSRNGLKSSIKITILNNKERIIVKDNCGGFNVSNIKTGLSSKGSENGVFLKLLTNKSVQDILGIRFNIYSGGGNTVAIIKFK